MFAQIKLYAALIINLFIAVSAFAAGWFLASYLDARTAEHIAAQQLKDDAARQDVVTAQILDNSELLRRQNERILTAEVNYENSITVLDKIRADNDRLAAESSSRRVQLSALKGICARSMSEDTAPSNASSSTSRGVLSQLQDGINEVLGAADEVLGTAGDSIEACEVDKARLVKAFYSSSIGL